MKFGKLDFEPAWDQSDLLAAPTAKAIKDLSLQDLFVTEIDDKLADTAAFCEHYSVSLEASANCVVVEAKRADKKWYVACMIQATKRIDVNNIVRRHLDARKVSFAPLDTATSLSGMEYGGITPIGLPHDWQILVDEGVAKLERAVIGSGLRKSKLLVTGKLLATLPNAEVLEITQR